MELSIGDYCGVAAKRGSSLLVGDSARHSGKSGVLRWAKQLMGRDVKGPAADLLIFADLYFMLLANMLLYYLIAYLRSFVCQFDGCCCVLLALYFPSIVENGRKSQCPAG